MSAMSTKRRNTRKLKPDLSAAEIKFCQAVITEASATEAFHQVWPHVQRVSAASGANLLLRQDKIANYIRKLQNDATEAAGVTTEGLARSYKQAVYVDRRGVFDKDGKVLNPWEWPQELADIVKEFEVEEQVLKSVGEGETTETVLKRKYKIKFDDRHAARESLAEWRGMIGGGRDKDKGKVEEDAGPKKPTVVRLPDNERDNPLPEIDDAGTVEDGTNPEEIS